MLFKTRVKSKNDYKYVLRANVIYPMYYCMYYFLFAVLRNQIWIGSIDSMGSWIRIQIQIDPEPDPGGKKDPKK